jgi:hypothetical protein
MFPRNLTICYFYLLLFQAANITGMGGRPTHVKVRHWVTRAPST